MRVSNLLCAAAVISAAGCIPSYDFTGSYDMTWHAVLSIQGEDGQEVTGGSAAVTIRKGIGEDELLVDLGPDFCRVSALYVEAIDWVHEPYFTIAPQPCWFGPGGKMLTISGTGTFPDGDESRLTIVLAGTFSAGEQRGSATLDFTPAW